jgi:hypothetical protein
MRVNFTVLDVLPLSRYVTVREMTVAEIRIFIQSEDRGRKAEDSQQPAAEPPQDDSPQSSVIGHLYLRDLLLFTDLTPADIDRLNDEEIQRLIAEGLAINAAFFSEDGGQKTEDGQQPAAEPPQDDSPQSSVVGHLEQAVARMVRVGHVNAWDYPWRVFKAAVAEAEASIKQ